MDESVNHSRNIAKLHAAEVLVVGGGLFGSIIAAELDYHGVNVVVLDDKRQGAGSKPAACLMKPGWFSSLGRDTYQPALDLLDRLYGIEDLQFQVGPTKQTVHWVKPSKILSRRDYNVYGRLEKVTHEGIDSLVEVRLDTKVETHFHVKTLIMATGIWSYDMVGGIKGLEPRWGWAHIWPGKIDPFIEPWAPYRQIVGFNRAADEVWIGDGTAYKNLAPEAERHAQSVMRCAKAAGLVYQAPLTSILGARPYVKEAKPALLEERKRGLWLATGGAKNGTLGAAWCANRLRKALT